MLARRRRQIPTKSPLKLKKLLIFAILVLLSMGIFKIFYISDIECVTNYANCDQEFYNNLNNDKNGLYFTAKNNLEVKLSNIKKIQSYNVRFVFPSKLLVYIVEKKAEAAIVLNGTDSPFFTIETKDGTIIEKLGTTPLPKIIYVSSQMDFNIGEKISKEMLFAVKVLSNCHKIYRTEFGFLKENYLTASVSDKLDVVFPQSGNMDEIFGSIELVLSRLNTADQDPKMSELLLKDKIILDLRYKNPVLR